MFQVWGRIFLDFTDYKLLSALLPQIVFFCFFLLSKLSCLLVIDRRVHCEYSSGLLSTRTGWDYFWPNFADSKSYTFKLRNSLLLFGFYILSASKFQSVNYLYINIPVCFCVLVEIVFILEMPNVLVSHGEHNLSTTWEKCKIYWGSEVDFRGFVLT